jgi:alpha-D-xyloside xylohydrolase
MRFGNPKPYSILKDIFKLYDKDGNEGALTGTYNNLQNTKEPLVRREDSLYYEDFMTVGRLLPKGLDGSNVVFEGQIEPKQTGEYRFLHYYSGYQKIFLNGKSVYTEDVQGKGNNNQEIWRTAWNPNARKFSANLEAGKKYDIRIEWLPDGGEAYCGLRALEPVDNATQNKLSFWSEMNKQLDYYFIDGENTDEIIKGYRTLTGKAQIMPEWLLGYWQSRERYKTKDELLTALNGFRKRNLPIDNIVIDWNYWKIDTWGSFEFDQERWSEPEAMIDSIHKLNAKVMISCWPKYYPNVDNFKELDQKGLIYQQSIKDSLRDWLADPINNWRGFTYGFYDAYDLEARRIFWRQLYDGLGSIGMDAWWMDASEPNVRDCTPMAYRKLLCGPTAMGSSDEYFNAYSVVNAEAIYDGQRAYETAIEKKGINKKDAKALDAATSWNQNGFDNDANFSPNNNRVFLLTRSGFPCEQRYSTATWSGDIGTRWEDYKAQITAGLNFSISGIPYWSQDIGGFSVEKRFSDAQNNFAKTKKESEDLKEWRELNVRWHQFGAFTPMYRVHGQYPFREPWELCPEGSEGYKSIVFYLDLRYRMMPYIYSLAADVYFNDYTILRPLIMDFGKDEAVKNIGYQFMFGPSFMINPIYTYKAREREVYFPKGEIWYDFYTGNVASNGGETKTVSAPYDKVPVYVRGGSIVPFGPKLEYTRQKQADNIRLYVYTGKNGEFNLYEDEGVNYGYEAGRFANIKFTYDDATKTLTISDRQGEFPGMLKERTFTIVKVSADAPQAYDPEAKGIEVKYNGTKQEIKL